MLVFAATSRYAAAVLTFLLRWEIDYTHQNRRTHRLAYCAELIAACHAHEINVLIKLKSYLNARYSRNASTSAHYGCGTKKFEMYKNELVMPAQAGIQCR